jgi:hypothetical protein
MKFGMKIVLLEATLLIPQSFTIKCTYFTGPSDLSQWVGGGGTWQREVLHYPVSFFCCIITVLQE